MCHSHIDHHKGRYHHCLLHELADYLYQKETITGTEFMKILEAKPEVVAAAATPEAE